MGYGAPMHGWPPAPPGWGMPGQPWGTPYMQPMPPMPVAPPSPTHAQKALANPQAVLVFNEENLSMVRSSFAYSTDFSSVAPIPSETILPFISIGRKTGRIREIQIR